MVAVVCVVALAALGVTLFAVGAHKNAQITLLRQQGAPVEVHVSTCTGLLGGSGSNLAGYACSGTFSFEGHRYSEALPGTNDYADGSTARFVAAPGDPPLLGTVRAVATERTSARVYIAPAVLALVAIALAVVLLVTRRPRRPRVDADTRDLVRS